MSEPQQLQQPSTATAGQLSEMSRPDNAEGQIWKEKLHPRPSFVDEAPEAHLQQPPDACRTTILSTPAPAPPETPFGAVTKARCKEFHVFRGCLYFVRFLQVILAAAVIGVAAVFPAGFYLQAMSMATAAAVVTCLGISCVAFVDSFVRTRYNPLADSAMNGVFCALWFVTALYLLKVRSDAPAIPDSGGLVHLSPARGDDVVLPAKLDSVLITAIALAAAEFLLPPCIAGCYAGTMMGAERHGGRNGRTAEATAGIEMA